MTVEMVKRTIGKIRRVMDEWEEVDRLHYLGETRWLEEHTRYAFIDPIIRALGWDTSDPKECHPEYCRPYNGRMGNSKRVDYAMFGEADSGKIGKWQAVPNIIIEAKAVGTNLDGELEQLEGYARASPRMTQGVAVLTNGEEWRLYKLVKGWRSLSKVECKPVDIRDNQHKPAEIAEILHSWLRKERSQ